MDFRVRPSSKKSQQSQRSLVQLPAVRGFQANYGSEMMRSLIIRLDNLQSNFSNYQDLWRRERDIANMSYLDIQKKIDMLEYKSFSNEKDLQQIKLRDNDQQINPKNDGQLQSIKTINQSEISVIKHALAQQREAHRQYAKHQAELVQQINRRQMRIETQLREVLNKQRQDYDSRLNDQLQEIRNNENLKQKKMENQYELMKTVISNTERKIFGEFERKLRNQTVIKDFIQQKVAQLRQQMSVEQRNIVAKQSKFVRQIKQSIQSIFTIIKNTQKQLTEELNQTQKLSANNLKKLSTTVELIKEKYNEDIKGIASQNVNLQNQIAEIKNFVNIKLQQNRQIIMQLQQDGFANSRLSKKTANNIQEAKETEEGRNNNQMHNSNLQKQFNRWKTITEQKNLNVFKEISSALKTMKIEWKKQNDQISSEVGSFKQSMITVKKSIPLEIKKSVQTIITIFNNQFDILAQQLSTISDMIALSKKEVQKINKQQIKKAQQETLKNVKQLIKDSNKQITILIQKKINKQEESLKNYTEQQIKFVKDLMLQKNANIEAELNQVSQSTKKTLLSTTSQLEQFSLKLKKFNQDFKDHIEQQRKDNMKKSIELEEAMRKNTNNIMEIYYKKCQFLVQGMKKAIQMNILKDIAAFKRDLQDLKDSNNKNTFKIRQQILNEMNQKMDKMAEERQNSEQIMHQAFDNQISTLSKSVQNQIGNFKLEMGQKVNELVQTVNQIQQKQPESNQQLEGDVKALKQAIWKMEALSFSEQAKNKAIMDRMGEDLTEVSFNLTVLANDLKGK